MLRVIIKDFLEKGKIKIDNGIPIPLEKVEEKDLGASPNIYNLFNRALLQGNG